MTTHAPTREWLIKNPLNLKVAHEEIVAVGMVRMKDRVRMRFAQHTVKECVQCPYARLDHQTHHMTMSEIFRLGCSLNGCTKAGWTKDGPMYKTTEEEMISLKEQMELASRLTREKGILYGEYDPKEYFTDFDWKRALENDAKPHVPPVSKDKPSTEGAGSW